MYQYDETDTVIQTARVDQYRDQTQRFLDGQLAENEFLPLRLQNGLYVQRFAPMLRIAVPYGMLNSKQMRMLATLSRDYDKGYAHISTRQNIQLNWPDLDATPDILEKLNSVEMHANQSSGNCIRNVTSDPFAGTAHDENEDPRPWCEIIRQWSTFHPEFSALPRKFKIAVNGADEDRAAIKVHDIGLTLTKDKDDHTAFDVWVGGGLGRTPVIASCIRKQLPWQDLITYLEAILRVYNRHGRRDNKYKARIKILVRALTPEVFADKVDAEWQRIKETSRRLPVSEVERVKRYFMPPAYEVLNDLDIDELASRSFDSEQSQQAFKDWYRINHFPHKQPGYSNITVCVKAPLRAPGDLEADEMDTLADIADQFCQGELRTTHEQNIVFTDVQQKRLPELFEKLQAMNLAGAVHHHLTDLICCPGGDFCALANAKSIPVAEQIIQHFNDQKALENIGDLTLNISGCMNACGHHHIGNIGILGVDKKGEEFYQILLGGDARDEAALGKIIGPSVSRAEVLPVLQRLIDTYLELREEGESFIVTYSRVGMPPFKAAAYNKTGEAA